MRALALAGFALSVTVGSSAPQERPDFSGRWEFVEKDASAPVIAQTMTVRQMTFGTPGTGFVAVDRHFGLRVETTTYLISGDDGPVTSGFVRNPGTAGQSTTSAARWEKAGLVLGAATFVGSANQATSERYELWALGDVGILTITIGERSNGAEMRTTKMTYRRVSR